MVTIKTENFEGSFPNSWVLSDNGSGSGDYLWAKSTCKAYEGSYSGWAYGGGSGSSLACGATYPNAMESWMKYGPFSLSDATYASATFQLSLHTLNIYDRACAIASGDGSNWDGTCWYTGGGAWYPETLSFSNAGTQGNLLGKPQVWFALVFQTDASVGLSDGAFVDNIVISKQVPNSADPLGGAGSAILAPDLPGTPRPAGDIASGALGETPVWRARRSAPYHEAARPSR